MDESRESPKQPDEARQNDRHDQPAELSTSEQEKLGRAGRLVFRYLERFFFEQGVHRVGRG